MWMQSLWFDFWAWTDMIPASPLLMLRARPRTFTIAADPPEVQVSAETEG